MAKGGQGKKEGGKNKKFGRNARRPSTRRRKDMRPDLVKKASNVVRAGGDLKAWAEARYKIEGATEPMIARAVRVAEKSSSKV